MEWNGANFGKGRGTGALSVAIEVLALMHLRSSSNKTRMLIYSVDLQSNALSSRCLCVSEAGFALPCLTGLSSLFAAHRFPNLFLPTSAIVSLVGLVQPALLIR